MKDVDKFRQALEDFTNLTEEKIDEALSGGAEFYTDDEAGKEEYREAFLGGLNDPEDFEDAWNGLEGVGRYRVDWYL